MISRLSGGVGAAAADQTCADQTDREQGVGGRLGNQDEAVAIEGGDVINAAVNALTLKGRHRCPGRRHR